MPRYRLTIQYDGTPFVGWQIQGTGLGVSVQGVIKEAVRAFCGEDVTVSGAGRTDAGVHATGQVAHIILTKNWRPDVVLGALNALVRPHPVAIAAVEQVPDTFDARFSAIRRHYLYRILNTRANLALEEKRAWRVPRKLDHEAMHEAGQVLVGKHDFTTFRSTECQAKSPVRTLERLEVTRQGEEIRMTVSARSFLHNQVRSIVGSLELVGAGRWSKDDLAKALEAKDRRACGMVAPPDGLYLTQVDYPEDV